MLLSELLDKMDRPAFVMQGLNKLLKDGLLKVTPTKWEEIPTVSLATLFKRYKLTPAGLKANVKILPVNKVWKPDLKQNDPKLRFSYPPVHKFDINTPRIFILKSLDNKMYLVDTDGGDRIHRIVRLVE